jgi:hypothetical protein
MALLPATYPDYRRFVPLIEVTRDSVTQHCPELFESLALSKNRVAEGSCLVAAFWRFFHDEDDFLVGHG